MYRLSTTNRHDDDDDDDDDEPKIRVLEFFLKSSILTRITDKFFYIWLLLYIFFKVW